MNYTLREIIEATHCHATGQDNGHLVIDTLVTDSRSLLATPESSIFFAIRTQHGDGSRYVAELYDKGVRAFVTDSEAYAAVTAAHTFADATFIIGNPVGILQSIASFHRSNCASVNTIGITGSNGKTIVKEWLYQLIGREQRIIRSPRSYNSQIGVPLSISLLRPDADLAIIEAGISEVGEMAKLESIIRPQVAVITNIGSAHQTHFETYKQKAAEKLTLARNANTLIYPADNETIAQGIAELSIPTERLFGWSKTNTAAPLYISQIQSDSHTTIVSFATASGQSGTYCIPFIDSASIENSITCLATIVALGLDVAKLLPNFSTLEPIAMRLEVKEGQNNLTLINDTYNSDVNSLSIALDFMSRRLEKSAQQRILILSDILQSREDGRDLYQSVATMVEAQGISRIIAVGPEITSHAGLFHLPIDTFADTQSLINSDTLSQLADATILIKGSRAFRFDKITALLEKRVHETILEVNLNAIVDNLNHYRAMMKPEEKIVCMVKASAYGAGSIEVSKTLQDHKVDYLAVAVADEGVALRQGGIHGHIMIMNPEMTSFHDLFTYNLEPEVYNFTLLRALIRAANREGITDFPIHIKLDTGMHRLGFDPKNDIDQLISVLQSQNALKPRSIFSHFVGSDGAQFNEFTRQQFAIYDEASRRIQGAFPHRIIRHICNSAGIERFPEYHLDMVRLGIGLYGINPYDNSVINTISTLKTTILQIREVPADETVGYSRWGKLNRTSRIAAIPIGYADGLNRHLGRGVGYCLVNGQKAPYVGNICMDVCMIDVTDIDCQEGDSVEIFGEHLPVTVLSDLLDTIPYEILTSVSERVKRVYYS